MGKKGKRSKRKTADRASIVAVQSKIEELNVKKIDESWHRNLFSQAVDELREGIQLIERQLLQHESSGTLHRMNLPTWAWFVKSKMITYSNLMAVELSRHNFDVAIQIYENLFEKALLRQGKGNIDTFISLSKSLITRGRKENLESDLHRSADLLRTIKHFDAAIVLGKHLEVLTGDRLSLATTYLEQYLVGDKEFLPEYFFFNMDHVLQKHKNDGFNTANAVSMLVLAQSTYLLHQLSSGDTEEFLREAIGFIEEYLDLISKVHSYCITCTLTTTESEVQLVCSGCRVACYCSIDHQRMSWKKEAVRGMRIGHEVLCPVMKAYRKWRHVCCNDKDGEDDKISRLRRRFERECLYCLSDGMGLKDKCFQK